MAGQDLEGLDVHVGRVGDEVGLPAAIGHFVIMSDKSKLKSELFALT